MTTYVAMVPNIAVNVPMCPRPLIITALQQTAQDFFTSTKVWQETLDALNVSITVRDIDIEHPTGARVVSILSAKFGAEPLTVKTQSQLAGLYADWRTETGDPKYLTMQSPDMVRLAPHPSVIGKIIITAALAPTLTSTEIPDALAAEYQTALEHGATKRLLMQAKKAWTDTNLAGYHGSQYAMAVSTAFARQSKAYTGAKLRSRLEYR